MISGANLGSFIHGELQSVVKDTYVRKGKINHKSDVLKEGPQDISDVRSCYELCLTLQAMVEQLKQNIDKCNQYLGARTVCDNVLSTSIGRKGICSTFLMGKG